jgi:hypothetical protein
MWLHRRMRPAPRTSVWAAVSLLAAGALACQRPVAPQAQQKPEPAKYPPAVLTGDGELVCNISSSENGHQKLTIVKGGGIEFDAMVSPIVDGRVIAHGPDKGGAYQFTSHLAKPGQASLPGVGKFDLDELETKVSVEMSRYLQPAGRGTAISFVSADMASRGIYVEFAGRGHAKNGEQFTFRVNLGAPTGGSGTVRPTNDNEISGVMNKMVEIRAPETTVLVRTTFERSTF